MHSKISPSTSAAPSHIEWEEKGENRSALWHSESGIAPPKRVVIGDDQMTADSAYRLACEGTAILWRGDFQNARQLLQAVGRRIETRPKKSAKAKAKERSASPDAPPAAPPAPAEAFNLHRLAQSQRARTLGMLLLPLDAEYATYSVVVDASGKVLYRGGFDSDKSHLRDDRASYLADAIDDVLGRRPIRRAEAKTLGCTLQLR